MTTLFISDLHLEDSRPKTTAIFLNFLKKRAVNADALYILGDLFETWVGDDDHTEFHQTVINALRTVTQSGTPVYFMHGNRDFLIGKQFLRESGCQLLKDPTLIQLYGKPILLTHGDTLCTQDVKYLKFRAIARNPILQWLFLAKSLEKRKKIAQKIRMASQQHTSQTEEAIMDVTPAEVIRVMKKYKVTLLIHGHTHRPAIHELQIDNQAAQRIVLTDWGNEGGALLYGKDARLELILI